MAEEIVTNRKGVIHAVVEEKQDSEYQSINKVIFNWRDKRGHLNKKYELEPSEFQAPCKNCGELQTGDKALLNTTPKIARTWLTQFTKVRFEKPGPRIIIDDAEKIEEPDYYCSEQCRTADRL